MIAPEYQQYKEYVDKTKTDLISFTEVVEAYTKSLDRMSLNPAAWDWEKAFAEEIIKIQAPKGYDSWKDAALDERLKRVALERKLKEISGVADELVRVGFDPNPTHKIYWFSSDEESIHAFNANKAVSETESFWTGYFGQLWQRCREQGQRIKEIVDKRSN